MNPWEAITIPVHHAHQQDHKDQDELDPRLDRNR